MTSFRTHSALALPSTRVPVLLGVLGLACLVGLVGLPVRAAAAQPALQPMVLQAAAAGAPDQPAAPQIVPPPARRPPGRSLFDPAAPGSRLAHSDLFGPLDLPVPASPEDAGATGAGDDTGPGALLDPGPLADDTADPDEPPLLARPDATLFTYGASVPRITCIPYRACTLLLSPDETILDLAIGDSERWQIETFSAAGTAPAVVFKPTRTNLLTNLVIKTDRRLYVLELLAPAPAATDPRTADVSYDALSAFRYPHRWAQSVARPAAQAAPPPASARGPLAGSSSAATDDSAASSRSVAETVAAATEPPALHFGYTVHRPLWPTHRLGWAPDIIYDDGHRTFVHLPAKARRHPLPAVLRLDGSGEPVPLDASLAGTARDWLLIPAVAPRLRLVTRTGDATRRLTLVRSQDTASAHRSR